MFYTEININRLHICQKSANIQNFTYVMAQNTVLTSRVHNTMMANMGTCMGSSLYFQ